MEIVIIGSVVLAWAIICFRTNLINSLREWWRNLGKTEKYTAKSKLSKIELPKIQFQDSGWVSLYVFCGWICCIGGIIVLFVGLASDHKDSDSEAFIYFCSALIGSLSCFFAAHVLRLQEKTAHHAEKNSELLKVIVDQTKKN